MRRWVALLALCVSGCAAMPPRTLPKADDTPEYTRLYPYYAEMCAVTQIDKKPGFGADIVSGGPGGHSVLYLNGVCRDRGAGYPVIRLCDPGHGVGLSANEHFVNANWVAVDGRDFLFDGDQDPSLPLTRETYAMTQIAAHDQGIYDGVVFHDSVFDDLPEGISREDWKYEVSIGTDYAVGFARSRYCARVPLSEAQMSQTVEYFNGLNAPYRSGEKQFDWNVFHNNCSHMTHAALAASCQWDAWPSDQSLLEAAVDFPVPKNEFTDMMTRGNDLDLTDPVAIFRDQASRRDLLANGRLPTQPGVIEDIRPVMSPNEVYGTNLLLIFYDEALTGNYAPRFDRMMSEPRYYDIQANLGYFQDLYRRVLAAKQPAPSYFDRLAPEDRDSFLAFYERYYAYIGRQSEIVAHQP
jgi:hypothetical protein